MKIEEMAVAGQGILDALAELKEPSGEERSARVHATVLVRCLNQAVAARSEDARLKAIADAGPPSSVRSPQSTVPGPKAKG